MISQLVLIYSIYSCLILILEFETISLCCSSVIISATVLLLSLNVCVIVRIHI